MTAAISIVGLACSMVYAGAGHLLLRGPLSPGVSVPGPLFPGASLRGPLSPGASLRGALFPGPPSDDPDELYRHREDLASAARAADLWAQRGAGDYEAAWKLSRVCYWLGMHLPERARRDTLERGITAGETAIRLGPNRPEGHFWLAASMGTLAESFGIVRGLMYRAKIKEELQRVLAIDAGWQGGSAEAALGRWYDEVPRLLGGSTSKAEEHLRRALAYDSQNLVALSFLADVLVSDGRRGEARTLLQRILDAPISTEWAPEDRGFKKQAVEKLRSLGYPSGRENNR